MGEPKTPRRSRTDWSLLSFHIASGTAIGALAGVFFIGIGVARAGLALLTGARMSPLTDEDLRLATYYVGGFALGGGLVGGVLPRARGVVGSYLAFAAAGMIVMTAIMASDGGLRTHDTVDWTVLLAVGAVFGLAFGIGWKGRA